MEPIPTTGYPENPDKQKRLTQLKTLIERHNFLVDQVSLLEENFKEKDIHLTEFKKTIKEDLEEQKILLEQVNELINNASKLKKETTKNFKEIIKKPLFEKLEKRINNLKYEDYIYREELMRKLQEP